MIRIGMIWNARHSGTPFCDSMFSIGPSAMAALAPLPPRAPLASWTLTPGPSSVGRFRVQPSRIQPSRIHRIHRIPRGTSETKADPSKASIQYGKWFTFWACFFGYSVCYFTRQSLSYTAPVLRQAMGWKGLSEIGKLQSLFPLAYGSSRFLGGLLGDLMSPKRVFALGLCVCSLLNIAFGLSSTLPQFAVFWLLNGCFQGTAFCTEYLESSILVASRSFQPLSLHCRAG